jgi:excisionase family DNA binding protein
MPPRPHDIAAPDDRDIITAPIDRFCRLAGIGRSKTYELIANGTLDSVFVGGRRLIVVDSWRRLVVAELAAARATAE